MYFIQAESGAIKIGIAKNPVARLRQLQTSHHEQLTILATTPGSDGVEKHLHGKFNSAHIRGEWFSPSEELLSYIATNGTPFATVVDKRRRAYRDMKFVAAHASHT